MLTIGHHTKDVSLTNCTHVSIAHTHTQTPNTNTVTIFLIKVFIELCMSHGVI